MVYTQRSLDTVFLFGLARGERNFQFGKRKKRDLLKPDKEFSKQLEMKFQNVH